MFRIEAGHQGVVIGKGQRRIGGDHTLSRDRAFGAQGQQVFGAVLAGVVVAEAIERDQHYIGFRLLRSCVRPVVDGDDLGGCAERQKQGQNGRPTVTREHFSRLLRNVIVRRPPRG
jgi:hypothetical protein